MKISKKLVIGLGVGAGIVLLSQTGCADNLQDALEAYYNNYTPDFMGREYDRVLFKNIIDSSIKGKQTDAEIISKLKFIIEDIKTLPIQTKCLFKIITDEINAATYLSLGGASYLKKTIGAKKFNELIRQVIRSIR